MARRLLDIVVAIAAEACLSMSNSNSCLFIGQTVGSYRVVRQLGEGGMGEVYEVIDTRLDRRAALKVVPPERARIPIVVERFQREAKAASQVRHPSVVHVFDYGVLPELDGAPYFVMEYLEGDTLRQRMQRAARQPGGRPGVSCLPLLGQIARALAAVHKQGLVHRDLKPSNIMIVADPDAPGGERAKLLDFGIVKVHQDVGASSEDALECRTRQGVILGTPLYMAPEQWRQLKQLDGKTDVYGLGVLTFAALAGRVPFTAPDAPHLALLHCNERPPSLASIDPSLPAPLVALVAQMLEKSPAHRPSMAAVAGRLDLLMAQNPDCERTNNWADTSAPEIFLEDEDEAIQSVEATAPAMPNTEDPTLVQTQFLIENKTLSGHPTSQQPILLLPGSIAPARSAPGSLPPEVANGELQRQDSSLRPATANPWEHSDGALLICSHELIRLKQRHSIGLGMPITACLMLLVTAMAWLWSAPRADHTQNVVAAASPSLP